MATENQSDSEQESKDFDPEKIRRPAPVLFQYYLLISFLSGPLSPIVFLPLWFRYATLRYRFDDVGVSMQWGILFRNEVYLTYRRIQDIHLTRNLLERWMGLAKISLQTASGSSQAEMKIEGILQPELLRDFLYSRMRGARDEGTSNMPLNPSNQAIASNTTPHSSGQNPSTTNAQTDAAHPNDARATEALVAIRDSLQTLVDRKISFQDNEPRSDT